MGAQLRSDVCAVIGSYGQMGRQLRPDEGIVGRVVTLTWASSCVPLRAVGAQLRLNVCGVWRAVMLRCARTYAQIRAVTSKRARSYMHLRADTRSCAQM